MGIGRILKQLLWLALVLGVGIGGGVYTGYIQIGDLTSAAGGFDEPEVGMLDSEITQYSTDSFTMRYDYYINNTNPIGGKVDEIQYDIYWSESQNGTYERLGSDEITELRVPPNNNSTYSTNVQFRSNEAVRAKTTAQSEGYIWVKLDGTVTFDFIEGAAYQFEQKVLVEG